MNLQFNILMLFLSWKKSKEERKIKKEREKNKEPKESKNKDKKEERKKIRKNKDRRRETEKEGGPKGLREKERETLKINKKCPCLGENKVFLCIKKKTKPKKKQNKKTTKTKKEGLGPSEVALWATSPDP